MGYYLYDAVMVYALAANKTINFGQDVRNGTAVYANMKGITYQSKSFYKFSLLVFNCGMPLVEKSKLCRGY